MNAVVLLIAVLIPFLGGFVLFGGKEWSYRKLQIVSEILVAVTSVLVWSIILQRPEEELLFFQLTAGQLFFALKEHQQRYACPCRAYACKYPSACGIRGKIHGQYIYIEKRKQKHYAKNSRQYISPRLFLIGRKEILRRCQKRKNKQYGQNYQDIKHGAPPTIYTILLSSIAKAVKKIKRKPDKINSCEKK